jgi:hypothetical protein
MYSWARCFRVCRIDLPTRRMWRRRTVPLSPFDPLHGYIRGFQTVRPRTSRGPVQARKDGVGGDATSPRAVSSLTACRSSDKGSLVRGWSWWHTKRMLWRRSTACTALVEGIKRSARCAVLIDGLALTCNPPLHNRRAIVERAEQGWQYSMVHVENNGNTNL